MKRISLGLLIFTLAAFPAGLGRAQDAATQQQLDKLSSQIQDLTDAQQLQNKRLDALEKSVSDLTDKVNSQPAANNYASVDDLKKLADQVQEIDRKRQADNEKIVQTLEKLGKVSAGVSSRRVPAGEADTAAAGGGDATAAPAIPQTGHYYTVAAGDSLSAIAKAYRANGVKVTTKEILAANPGLDPTKLYIGKKIFIPDPNAK